MDDLLNYKGAIFDLDGTLLDSMPIWDRAGGLYLESLGVTPTSHWRRDTKSKMMSEICDYFRAEYGITKTDKEICDGINDIVGTYYRTEAEIKPGVIAYLRKLKQNGVKICVASATDRSIVEIALEKHGILDYVEKIFTCSEVGANKHDPLIYEKALEYLGSEKNEVLVYEDATYCIKTAKNAGFTVVGVYDDSSAETDAEKRSICDYYINSFHELLNIPAFERKVNYYETDLMKIVHHSNYIRWLEEARIDYFEKIGAPFNIIEEEGLTSPVLDVHVSYKNATRFGDSVKISLKLVECTGVAFSFEYRVVDKASGSLRMIGTTRHCFIDENFSPVNLKKKAPHYYCLFKSLLGYETCI